jgi:hypothetical protein
MKKDLPNLDSYCDKLLHFFTTQNDKIRFNDLYERLDNDNIIHSKPTLSLHLKHLVKKKLIIRKVEDAQKVSYKINHQLFEKLDSYRDVERAAGKALAHQTAQFFSAPIEKQINIALLEACTKTLNQIKLKFEIAQDSTRSWEKSYALDYLSSSLFQYYQDCFLEHLKEKVDKDNEQKREIMETLDNALKEVQEIREQLWAEISPER